MVSLVIIPFEGEVTQGIGAGRAPARCTLPDLGSNVIKHVSNSLPGVPDRWTSHLCDYSVSSVAPGKLNKTQRNNFEWYLNPGLLPAHYRPASASLENANLKRGCREERCPL